MKKILSLVLALAMILMVGAAFADGVKIEITRDDTYAGAADTPGNSYKAYKVFSASYDTNTSTGGDATAAGAPGDVTGTATAAAYTASSTVAAKLGSWVAATDTVAAHWQKAEGNLWFNLTPIAGSTNYSVTWDSNVANTSANAQAAAQWLLTNSVYDGQGIDLEFANGKWSKDGLEKGYYIVEGGIGTNLIAATTDVTVKEKNDYPPLDKTQADEDDATQNNTDRGVAVGDVLTYEVKVTIPATAKVGDRILVWDKQSQGLTYNNNVAVKTGSNTGNATISDPAAADVPSGSAWAKLITVVANSQGTDVVFTFTMTVNSNALIDTGKTNESGLKYGNANDWKYESNPDHVEYKTYFAGIEKVDGANAETKLAGVVFTLKEGTAEFKVVKPEGKDYYVYDANGSSSVVTDENGLIKIRGLDGDKTYTLTETSNPNPGYNLLAEPVTLTLKLDSITVTNTDADGTSTTTTTSSYDGTTADQFDDVQNNKGTLLPSTGGIGTTIFYVVGGILLIGAAIILVSRRRAHN